MSDPAPQTVIRRKLSALPAAPLGEAEGAAIWREVLPKVSEAQFELALALRSLRARRLDPDAFVALAGEKDLVIGLRGAGGAAGLAIFDPSAVASLIEALTLGEVRNSEPADRVPTATDAALAGDALDAWLGAVAQASGAVSGILAATAGAYLPNGRAARLSLRDEPLDVLTLRLDLGEGAREGCVTLGLPPVRASEGPSAISGSPAWLAAPVRIHAELARLDLPYGRIRTLAPGATIDLPLDVVGNVRLKGEDGRVAARGRLGQSGGFRAVRLQNDAQLPPRTSVDTADLASLAPDTGSAESSEQGELPQIEGVPELPDPA